MGDVEVKDILKRWGHATVARFVVARDGHSMGETVLSRNKDLAPGTRENAMKALVGRDGTSRRQRMAFDPDAKHKPGDGPRMRLVPMWACDPVPAHNDASPPHDREPIAAIDIGLPDELLWVESAIAALSRVYPLRAKVLREEFTGTGTQRMKAGRVQREYGGALNVNQYRAELRKALEWIDMKRAA